MTAATNKELITAIDKMSKQSGNLIGEVSNLRGEVGTWAQYGRHNRKLIWGLVASLLLDVILTAGLAFGLNATHDAAVQAQAATSLAHVSANNLKVICEAGNSSNAKQIALWKSLFTFPPPLHETAEAKKVRLEQTVKFKAILAKTFAQQDCK